MSYVSYCIAPAWGVGMSAYGAEHDNSALHVRIYLAIQNRCDMKIARDPDSRSDRMLQLPGDLICTSFALL